MHKNSFKENMLEFFNKVKLLFKKLFSIFKDKSSVIYKKLKYYFKNLVDNNGNKNNGTKKFKMDKITIKKIIISLCLVIALVIQIAFLSYLVKGILPDSEKDKENAIMNYTSSGKIDYRVYLKPNNFISSKYLESGEAYILNLIDYININTNYNFSSSSKTKVSGNNKLVASLKVYYKESTNREQNPEVMKKEKILCQKVISFDDSNYALNNEYKLYLDEYLKILRDFQDQIKISVEGYLEVSSASNLNGEVGGIKYNSNYSNMIKIPLTGSVINIESESSDAKTNYVYESELVKSNKKVMSFIIIANILDFIVVCFLLKKLFLFTNKSEYQRTLSKILKTYDEIIVNTTNILDVNKYKIIEIPEFKEILNLSRELLLPIMNYEVLKGKETWFYVIKDDILYRFIVKDKENNKDKDNVMYFHNYIDENNNIINNDNKEDGINF